MQIAAKAQFVIIDMSTSNGNFHLLTRMGNRCNTVSKILLGVDNQQWLSFLLGGAPIMTGLGRAVECVK